MSSPLAALYYLLPNMAGGTGLKDLLPGKVISDTELQPTIVTAPVTALLCPQC